MNRNLSEKWIKASIAGTIWAASEIVLGSFLHNLKIPFSGNILTAIGIIILISISHIWREKGLFWRAGIICAIMKTMSPSAVIFGPMIAIFSESVLLEISTRLLGRNIAGYSLGAMLAMSWNLFHKIGSYILYYGANIIDVYTNLLKMAQKQLNIRTDIVWLPIIVLLVVYAAFGLLASVIGIKVGRKMLQQPSGETVTAQKGTTSDLPKSAGQFNYSVLWLAADILLIIASFLILSFTEWYIWAPFITMISVIWALRYRRAMKQLLKPKFWIIFVVITLLTAFVFTAGGEGDFWRTGLLTGISMNFRAVVIIMGFSALGTELYNPVIRSFFNRTAFRNLPLAVEISVESLPDFIAVIPDFKSFIKNPVSVFYSVLSRAGSRFSEIKGRNREVFMITGARAEGKTSYTKELITCLKENKVQPGGFVAERVKQGEETTGYDLINVENNDRKAFLRTGGETSRPGIGKFTILADGFEFGRKILQQNGKKRIIVIDEIGALELRGEGWANSLDELVKNSQNHILIVVRNEFSLHVKEKFALKDVIGIKINELDIQKACKLILEKINGNKD